MKKSLILTIFISFSINIFAADSFIAGVFIQPVSRYFSMEMDANNDEFSIEQELVDDIIEVVSGMVYGWKFEYVPSDIKREIDEIFTLKPVAMIKNGDPNMHFRDNWVKDYIMYQNIVYNLVDFQKKRIKSWKSTLNPTSSGEGEASIHVDNGKSLSLKEALKDSIKKEFQSRGKDKPRSIEGQILLKENPRVFMNAGTFQTQIEVIMIYKDIEEYRYQ